MDHRQQNEHVQKYDIKQSRYILETIFSILRGQGTCGVCQGMKPWKQTLVQIWSALCDSKFSKLALFCKAWEAI